LEFLKSVLNGYGYTSTKNEVNIGTIRLTYITLSFESYIPISIVIENTGDKPATILQYYTKLSSSFIKEQINAKLLFKDSIS